jgi:predicted nucleotidyltransferase
VEESQILNNTVFMTIGGSHAYGTNVEGSDVDRRGVCIVPDKRLYYGLNRRNFEQKDSWESGEDMTVYDFRKAVDLILGGNPNMVDLLFTPPSCWRTVKAPWWEMMDNRQKFLSKKMRYTYGGYAFAQLKRIKHHRGYLLNPPKKKPERSDFGLPEQKAVSNDDLQAFLWLISKLLHGTIECMALSETTKLELASINFIGLVQGKLSETDDQMHVVQKLTGMPDNFVDICMREKRYMSACKAWESYARWKKERNPKRAAMEAKWGYDTKHAMHLVRLIRMGTEILETGVVNVLRPDGEELIAIRNGAWSFDKLQEFAEVGDKKLDELYKTTKLPDQPETNAIENLCTHVVESYVNGRNA